MNITGHTMELLNDPFGLLSGDRYEFLLDLDVDEEDELYSENGVGLKVIYGMSGDRGKILQYHLFEKGTGKFFDFSLEPEEEEMANAYCEQHIFVK